MFVRGLVCLSIIISPVEAFRHLPFQKCKGTVRNSRRSLVLFNGKDDEGGDRELYESFRKRKAVLAKDEGDATPIPFFAEDEEEDERASRRPKARGMDGLGWADRNDRSTGYNTPDGPADGPPDRRKWIAETTVNSLIGVSFAAILLTGLSYLELGNKFVHERGDMAEVRYTIPAARTGRYANPDALLLEEIPSGQRWGADDMLYNQLFDGSLYRSSQDVNPAPGSELAQQKESDVSTDTFEVVPPS